MDFENVLKQLNSGSDVRLLVKDGEEKCNDFLSEYLQDKDTISITKANGHYMHNLYFRIYDEDQLLDFLQYLTDTRIVKVVHTEE